MKTKTVPRANGATEAMPTVKSLIRQARGAQSQKVFAAVLGVTQDSLCKYEKGRVNPPASVIDACLRIVHLHGAPAAPDAKTVAKLVQSTLVGEQHAPLRRILAKLLEHMAPQQRRHVSRSSRG